MQNMKKILGPDFLQINKTYFENLLIFIHRVLPWKRHIRQLNYQKKKFVLSTCGKVKKVNKTQASKTVFGHLKN